MSSDTPVFLLLGPEEGEKEKFIKNLIDKLSGTGNEIVEVLGNPDYYPRFGFDPASTYRIKCEYDVPD